MSLDPRRLIDEGPAELRALLRSADLDEPSDAQLERLTLRVAFLFPLMPGGGAGGDGGGGGQVPVPATGAAAATGAVTKVGLSISGVKAVIVATSIATVGGGIAVVSSLPKPAAIAPVIERQLAPAEPAHFEKVVAEPPGPVVLPPPLVKPAVAPRERVEQVSPAPESPSETEDELVKDAVQLIRSGEAAGALARTEQHVTLFPTGEMAQERELVAVEALMALGRVDEASARAQAFRARWPTSAHITQLDSLVPVGPLH